MIKHKKRLDLKADFPISPGPQQFCFMARVCSIRGSKVRVGRKIHRSGLAKKKGGIGRHVTKTVKRKVYRIFKVSASGFLNSVSM